MNDLEPPRPWTAEFAVAGCEHYQAPGSQCWMCREGEHFTADGQQALDLLSALKEGRSEREQFLLSYAQGAVVSDQWKQFSHRMSAAAEPRLAEMDARSRTEQRARDLARKSP